MASSAREGYDEASTMMVELGVGSGGNGRHRWNPANPTEAISSTVNPRIHSGLRWEVLEGGWLVMAIGERWHDD